LAKVGYSVFPAKGKIPTVEGGFYAATTDASQIAEWITEGRENHDVAFATGIVSGVVVVEADTPEAYERMEMKFGPPHVLTRRGGHWYFRHPKNGKVSSKSLGGGLDRKGDGGYVVAPPSTGKTWTDGIPDISALPLLPNKLQDDKGASTGEAEPAELPPWAMEKVTAHTSKASTTAIGERICDGARNSALTSIAGTLRRRGLGEAAISAALLGINGEACRPPLHEAEVRRIARSIARYEPDDGTPWWVRVVARG
jgi:putative DNA primase/helicase